MKPTEKEGGAAFPWANDSNKEYYWINHGMSLRDYFAAAALTGYASHPLAESRNGEAERLAQAAYRFADAMIQARKECA